MTASAADADQGYFPAGRSMLRRVHEQRIVGLLYGQRGLMVGAVDPVVTVGTFMSTSGAAKPFDRLVRTARVFEKTFFGTREEADRELARVHRLHQRTKGELDQPAGPYPAGTAYDALDPQQMLWTLACIADSGQTLYEELARPLTPVRARGALAGLPPLGRALPPRPLGHARDLSRVPLLVRRPDRQRRGLPDR